MSAARTLGWPQVGLAAILDTRFGVTMNKKYQRADWGHRPLTPEQLDYARLDTHYLVALRELQLRALTESGCWPEAHEEFARLARVRGRPVERAEPLAFWRVNGAHDLTPAQAAVLKEVFAYREEQAGRLDRPPFKVMGESTLIEIARRTSARHRRSPGPARPVAGADPPPRARLVAGHPTGTRRSAAARAQAEREPDDVRERYDLLRKWRKEKARARGVESDVIVPRAALWDLGPPRPSHARRVDAHHRPRPLAARDIRGRDSEVLSAQ